MPSTPVISILVSFFIGFYCYDYYESFREVRIIYCAVLVLTSETSIFLSHSYIQDYGEIEDQPTRIVSVNSVPNSGVLQPSPTIETPVQDPGTEAKNPCMDNSPSHSTYSYDSYDIYYEFESSDDPCDRVTTTTEGRKKKINAVAPISAKKCRLY